MKMLRHSRRQAPRRRNGRRNPWFERLEARELLAVVTVDTNIDTVDGTTSSITALLATPGADQKISLREAILATNNTVGQDEIRFSETVFTATDGVPDKPIVLSGTVLSITDRLIITGLGATRIKIDANQASGAIDFKEPYDTQTLPALVLDGLWVTRSNGAGIATSANWPTDPLGSIGNPNPVIVNNVKISANAGRGITGTRLTINRSLISDNADGGISTYWLTMDDSEVSNNFTTSGEGHGGGIIFLRTEGGKEALIRSSLITGNYTTGPNALGGAIYTPNGQRSSHSGIYPPVVQLINSTLLRNYTLGTGAAGGAIYAEKVQLDNVDVVDNYTQGASASGGAVSANEVDIRNSRFTGNATRGASSLGGAVRTVGYKGTNTLPHAVASKFVATNSLFSNNYTEADGSPGGAVAVTSSPDGPYIAYTQITNCQFRENYTKGVGSDGGAVTARTFVQIDLTSFVGNRTSGRSAGGGALKLWDLVEGFVSNSLFAHNSTGGDYSPGGATIYRSQLHGPPSALSSTAPISNTTFAENSTSGVRSSGGAIWGDFVRLDNSTVVGNSTSGVDSPGGGLILNPLQPEWAPAGWVFSSVIADNQSTSGNPDIRFTERSVELEHTLIGTNEGTTLTPAPVGQPDAKGNLIGSASQPIDPRLRPLAYNGGPTMTMAPYATSPVVNVGSNPQNLATDQRGPGFQRVVGSAADMGAIELQQGVGLAADTDFDGDVDSADLANLLAGWTGALPQYQGTQGQAQGDSDADGDVDSADLLDMLAQWKSAVAPSALPAPAAPLRSVRVSSDRSTEKTTPVQPARQAQVDSLLAVNDANHFKQRRRPSSRRMR